jgi:hypothetical protein
VASTLFSDCDSFGLKKAVSDGRFIRFSRYKKGRVTPTFLQRLNGQCQYIRGQ